MKLLFVTIALLVLAMFGCEVDRTKTYEILSAEGCTQTKLEGWSWAGCGKDDNQSMEFTCVRNNTAVHGVVCGQYGLLSKGYTVRYK